MDKRWVHSSMTGVLGPQSKFRLNASILLSGFLIASILLSFSGFHSVSATGVHRYVSIETGEDSGDCTTLPCLTIGYAISKSVAGDTIHITAGIYYEHNLYINKALTFIGDGMDHTIIDGSAQNYVVYALANTTISGITIRNGRASSGGGIWNTGSMTLTQVKITENHAQYGAGLKSYGPLSMTDCIVSNNHADLDASSSIGGGLFFEGGTVSLNRVTISGNTATYYGGGVQNQGDSDGPLGMINVTITENTAKFGGGLNNGGAAHVTIINSTISGNHFSTGGSTGGTTNWGNILFKNTIISGNDGNNCENNASWTSLGYNLDSGSTCLFTATGDMQNTSPLLGTLHDNGGYNQTMALLPGSPAINAGTNDGCPATDQRGVTRPQGAACDIGAYEVEELPGAFNKTTPSNGVTNRPTSLTLKWGASTGATNYEYCYDKTNDGKCGSGWKSAGTALSAGITNLAKATYYWQVRAKNGVGKTTANGGTWWSFTVLPKPGAFGKTSPVINSINKPTTLTLYWAASANAARYEYCIKKSMSAPCTWKPTGEVNNAELTGLLKNQKYYWQVRAKNVNGTTIANGGTWWNFTTVK